MKPIIAVLSIAALSGAAFAGERIAAPSKTYQPTSTECFRAGEWQVDLFGFYGLGLSGHAGPLQNDTWGGGAAVNYFMTRNWGLGIDGFWYSAQEPPRGPVGPLAPGVAPGGGGRSLVHNFSGSLIYRYPMDSICMAPYVYGGGGISCDSVQYGSVHVGAGVEKRLNERLGIFTDARWTYYGDRFGRGDQNNFMFRGGVRFVF